MHSGILNVAHFEYNDEGMRIKKTNFYTHSLYEYNGSLLVTEYSEHNIEYGRFFFYDEADNLYAMKYDESLYYYVRSVTNDIVKMLDSDGNELK